MKVFEGIKELLRLLLNKIGEDLSIC